MRRISDVRVLLHDPEDAGNPLVRRFLGHPFPRVEQYHGEESLAASLAALAAEGIGPKEVVVLKEFRGRLFQQCPGSPGVICCDYYLLNTCFDCLFGCVYCFLHSYLNAYGIVQFTNLDTLAAEITAYCAGKPDHIFRIGTGEFTDSLMFDEITGIARSLIEAAAPLGHVMMEFKTKSANIDHLLGIEGKGNAVLAWSLNTPRNITLFEKETATLDERLDAASRAAAAGYFVAFHFDPIIRYDGFIDDYLAVIDRLFAAIDPSRIVWISLGCYRYSPSFKEIIREKYPDETLTVEELFPDIDGKLRYLKKRRVEIYSALRDRIFAHSKLPYVYLCMETPAVWEALTGRRYAGTEELAADMHAHLRLHFLRAR